MSHWLFLLMLFHYSNANCTFPKDKPYQIIDSPLNCPCFNQKLCLKKCCGPGFYYKNDTCFPGNFREFFVELHNEIKPLRKLHFSDGLSFGLMDCDSFKLDPKRTREDLFFLQNSSGKLWWKSRGKEFELNRFCVDWDEEERLISLVCFDDEVEVEVVRRVKITGMIISMPFLLCTFIVYALLPERNLHMKALMCYVLSLFFGYLFLVSVQLASRLEAFCEPFAVGILFFFLSSFLWMNVICMDIWFTFSGMRGFSGSIRMAEKKRFIFYSIYAYGTAFFLTIIVLIMNHVSPSNAWYNPSFGESSCFIMQHYPLLLYFYGPMALLICANSILFGLTAWKIAQMRRDTKMLRREESQRHSSAENDQRKFFLYLKLLLAMGVNWSMEVISWAVEWNLGREKVPSTVWILTDFCNAIYGLFIFILFVCKPKIWQMLKKRYYKAIGRPFVANTTTNSHFTQSSGYTQSDHTEGHNGEEKPLRMSNRKSTS